MTNVTDIASGQNSTVESASLGTDFIKLLTDVIPEIEQLLAANGTATTSAIASKRATSDILQEIEAVLESFLKRDSIEGTAPDNTGKHSRRTTTPKLSSSEVSSATSWLKNLWNVFNIGTGGLAIAGAVDSSFSSNSTKRQFDDVEPFHAVDLTQILGAMTQLNERRTTSKLSTSQVSSVTSWLKTLGDVFGIGTGGLAIAGVVDGGSSSNSTKREIEQVYNGIDLAALLDGATPQFNDRRTTAPKVSSSEVSSLESGLSKLAGVFSVGGTIASLLSGFEGTSNSSGISIKRSDDGVDSSDYFALSTEEKRSITSDVLEELVSLLGDALGGSGSSNGISIKRSAGFNTSAPDLTSFLTPQELQELQQMLSEQPGVQIDTVKPSL